MSRKVFIWSSPIRTNILQKEIPKTILSRELDLILLNLHSLKVLQEINSSSLGLFRIWELTMRDYFTWLEHLYQTFWQVIFPPLPCNRNQNVWPLRSLHPILIMTMMMTHCDRTKMSVATIAVLLTLSQLDHLSKKDPRHLVSQRAR